MAQPRTNGAAAGARALVTGASSGIGLELARLCAADGRDLVLVARNGERLREVAERLAREHRISAEPLAADLALPGAGERIAEALAARDIAVDFLVNNAGIGWSGPFAGTPLEVQRRMMALNMGAPADLCRLFLPPMLERGEGRVLNVGSAAGYVPGLGFSLYAATKSFLLSLTEGIAGELRGTGVSASVLCPGPVDTPFLKSAGIRSLRGVRRFALADAAAVARAGYRGAMRGAVVVNPGVLPRLVPLIPRLLPRAAARVLGARAGRLPTRRSTS